MRFLIEFIGGEQNSKISSLIKCSENEAKILRHLSKNYVEGTPQSSAYDVLCAVFGSEEYKFLAGLADVKNLLESGWIVQGFSIFKNPNIESRRCGLKFTRPASQRDLALAAFSKNFRRGRVWAYAAISCAIRRSS